jgi:hypothetical protein
MISANDNLVGTAGAGLALAAAGARGGSGWLVATLDGFRGATLVFFFSMPTTAGGGGEAADAYACTGDSSLVDAGSSDGGAGAGTIMGRLVSMTTRSGGC